MSEILQLSDPDYLRKDPAQVSKLCSFFQLALCKLSVIFKQNPGGPKVPMYEFNNHTLPVPAPPVFESTYGVCLEFFFFSTNFLWFFLTCTLQTFCYFFWTCILQAFWYFFELALCKLSVFFLLPRRTQAWIGTPNVTSGMLLCPRAPELFTFWDRTPSLEIDSNFIRFGA